jgi:hypothetical protein
MQLGLSARAILNHQTYDNMTRDSLIKIHVQWNGRMCDETDGSHFEYLL